MHDVQSPSHAADFEDYSVYATFVPLRANFISKTPPFQDASLMENNVKKITHK